MEQWQFPPESVGIIKDLISGFAGGEYIA